MVVVCGWRAPTDRRRRRGAPGRGPRPTGRPREAQKQLHVLRTWSHWQDGSLINCWSSLYDSVDDVVSFLMRSMASGCRCCCSQPGPARQRLTYSTNNMQTQWSRPLADEQLIKKCHVSVSVSTRRVTRHVEITHPSIYPARRLPRSSERVEVESGCIITFPLYRKFC